ncbi:hypothetical protein CEP52_010078 [Fusarium oligoseptatum]|uniref:Uncharacterized protein n=1 Tax=Fusarium oligoseptatum TaxID=2604345 RepID=A0A428T9Z2_9HYPO|nr:hypothetical protein CEP52_010078 [Fusarium oligoseptatum]
MLWDDQKTPCRNFHILNFVCIVPDSSLKEETTESWTALGDREELLSLFSDFPAWVQDYLRKAKNKTAAEEVYMFEKIN